MTTSQSYGPDYFKSANYADYLERGDRYKRTACELVELLRKIGQLDDKSRIIDYGCAVGLLMDGLKEAGCSRVIGIDVSEWARNEAERRGHLVYRKFKVRTDILIALDVFEHMTDSEIGDVFWANAPQTFVARIPVSTDGKEFHLAVSRADPTHINCKTKEQWETMFRALGYLTTRLHLFSVYDSPGVACLLGLRIGETK